MSPKPLLDIGDAEWTIVDNILRRHVPEREVWAFGSRARWTAKEFSDLDLFIQGEQPLAGEDAAALAEAFAESDLPWKVDVVDGATVSAAFRDVIERDKVVVRWRGESARENWDSCVYQTIAELLASSGGSIKTGPFGTVLKASEYSSEGVPLISVREIGHGDFHVDARTPRVNVETLKRLPEYILEEGDIVFARKGGIERCALIRKAQSGWFLGSDGIRLRPPKNCDARFLAYTLQTSVVKKWLLQHSTGSTMASLNQAIIGRIPVRLPAIDGQRRVADMLEQIDSRITLLRETNATLEAMAQALFKSWFVDFDPVRAKMEGRVPEGMDEATAALFPDGFNESELRVVPIGWKLDTLNDISHVGIGKTPPRKEAQWFTKSEEDNRWVSIRDMGQQGVFLSETSESLTNEAVDRFNIRIVPNNTVMLSFKMTIGRLAISDGEMTTNEAIAHFKLDKDALVSSEFIYLTLKAFDFSSLSSTSSIADAVNSKTVKNIPILVPQQTILNAFQEKIAPLFSQLKLNAQRIRVLSNLRDTLLPRLISGQLRLPEAMKEVAAA